MTTSTDSYTSHFVHAVEDFFATMLSTPIEHAEPRMHNAEDPLLDITTTLGITGTVSGQMMLTFSREAAECIVAAFVGMAVDFDDPDFPDAIGEVGNIIAGSAKAKLKVDGLSITCPSVILGSCKIEVIKLGVPTMCVDFDGDLGPFRLEVTLENSANTDDLVR